MQDKPKTAAELNRAVLAACMRHGPVVLPNDPFAVRKDLPKGVPLRNPAGLPGRNEPCPCGSGKKYKKCCLRKDMEALAQ
jgi:uncharacterized protein YecA (UPF0149 family)